MSSSYLSSSYLSSYPSFSADSTLSSWRSEIDGDTQCRNDKFVAYALGGLCAGGLVSLPLLLCKLPGYDAALVG